MIGEVVIVFGGSLLSKKEILAERATNPTLMQASEELVVGRSKRR